MNAIKDYTIKMRKRITIEYILIAGMNDSQKDSIALKGILSSIKCNLNVIPYNEIDSIYKRPDKRAIYDFLDPLSNAPFPLLFAGAKPGWYWMDKWLLMLKDECEARKSSI